jgi:hypothetical protein
MSDTRITHVLILLFAVACLAAQQPPDESNVPDIEKRIPPGHYCKREGVPIGRTETRAHSCSCKYSCSLDEDGTIVEHESADCLAYCHVNKRRCTCHVEEPCDPKGGGLTDMDGHLVAVRVRR